ncbi:hypothetical protein EVA_00422, partial [gut metagenome]
RLREIVDSPQITGESTNSLGESPMIYTSI